MANPTPIDPELLPKFGDFLSEASTYERHFNDVQSRYRALASTWLLAAFAGIGFVLSQQKLSLHVDPALLAAGLGLAGAAGILLLWSLDLLVYHRLLDAVFAEGFRVEKDNPGLPQVRINMVKVQHGRGVLPRVVWFYLGATDVLLLVAGIAFELWLGKRSAAGTAVVGAVYLVAIIALNVFLYRKTCKPGPFTYELADEMGLIPDEENTSLYPRLTAWLAGRS